MPATDTHSDADEALYRIGAVCRLTGLSQHVIRVWEKRYAVVEPMRSETGRRLYREADIQRLSMLKTLVDRGQAIGSIASLDDAELEERVRQSAGLDLVDDDTRKPTLVLVGESLATTVDECSDSPVFELKGHFKRLDEGAEERARLRPDVVVVEQPTLHADSLVEVNALANELSTRHLIVVYDYAPRQVLQRFSGDRITALRSPLDIAALEAVIAWRFGQVARDQQTGEMLTGVTPARIYNDRELAHLAMQSPAIACECPMHLAQLIAKLVHFETYSADCESRNEEDAALHAYLHHTTSRVRHTMERALARVVELENLSSLPDD